MNSTRTVQQRRCKIPPPLQLFSGSKQADHSADQAERNRWPDDAEDPDIDRLVGGTAFPGTPVQEINAFVEDVVSVHVVWYLVISVSQTKVQ